ncbi:hypothetical protein KR009_007882 [Drosophila setifemur]|nr:hypothetical protein KR009_007882 [Drosophila setifemur]
MKLFGLCCLLVAFLGCLIAPSMASPSRHSGPGSGSGGNPFQPPPPPSRPFYYDAPIRRPGQPATRYA